jgi:hypothetical protein
VFALVHVKRKRKYFKPPEGRTSISAR